MLDPLSCIHAKSPFCCIETVANNAQNRRCVVVFAVVAVGWVYGISTIVGYLMPNPSYTYIKQDF